LSLVDAAIHYAGLAGLDAVVQPREQMDLLNFDNFSFRGCYQSKQDENDPVEALDGPETVCYS